MLSVHTKCKDVASVTKLTDHMQTWESCVLFVKVYTTIAQSVGELLLKRSSVGTHSGIQ